MSCDVLLIEDELALREVVYVNLRLRGISVETAATGAEGLEKAISGKPRLILLDARLPDIDGWDLCVTIKKQMNHGSKPRIVFLTAAAQQADRKRAFDLGAEGYLSKPFDITDLIEEVRRQLALAQ